MQDNISIASENLAISQPSPLETLKDKLSTLNRVLW